MIKNRNIAIRPATPKDVDIILGFVKKLAEYEKKKSEDVTLTAKKITQHGFSDRPYFYILIAEADNKPVGYALYFFTYAASLGAPILYLEDLFVVEEFQKQGIGTKLLSHLANIAKKENCCRMEWHVLNWNKSAISFYESIGAVLKTDLIQMRLAS